MVEREVIKTIRLTPEELQMIQEKMKQYGNCYAVSAPGGGSDGFPTLCYIDEDNWAVYICTLP